MRSPYFTAIQQSFTPLLTIARVTGLLMSLSLAMLLTLSPIAQADLTGFKIGIDPGTWGERPRRSG